LEGEKKTFGQIGFKKAVVRKNGVQVKCRRRKCRRTVFGAGGSEAHFRPIKEQLKTFISAEMSSLSAAGHHLIKMEPYSQHFVYFVPYEYAQ